jgi:hypothetical protein
MFLQIVAAVRTTETWTASHLAALFGVLLVLVWVVHSVRVRRRR